MEQKVETQLNHDMAVIAEKVRDSITALNEKVNAAAEQADEILNGVVEKSEQGGKEILKAYQEAEEKNTVYTQTYDNTKAQKEDAVQALKVAGAACELYGKTRDMVSQIYDAIQGDFDGFEEERQEIEGELGKRCYNVAKLSTYGTVKRKAMFFFIPMLLCIIDLFWALGDHNFSALMISGVVITVIGFGVAIFMSCYQIYDMRKYVLVPLLVGIILIGADFSEYFSVGFLVMKVLTFIAIVGTTGWTLFLNYKLADKKEMENIDYLTSTDLYKSILNLSSLNKTLIETQKKRLTEKAEKVQEMTNEVNQMIVAATVKYFPQEFWNDFDEAVELMESGRADNLKELYGLLEQRKARRETERQEAAHRQSVEQMERERLVSQKMTEYHAQKQAEYAQEQAKQAAKQAEYLRDIKDYEKKNAEAAQKQVEALKSVNKKLSD